MTEFETDLYRFDPHPEMPGWMRWHIKDGGRFNGVVGDLAVRVEGNRVILRMEPQSGHSNLLGTMHGGVLLTFIDNALFIGSRVLSRADMTGVTVELSTQFMAPVDLARPVELALDILRETGRLMFMRGTVEQGEDMVASFTGIVRKSS